MNKPACRKAKPLAPELLTRFPVGKPDEEGRAPQGSINYLVAAQLMQLSMMRQAYSGALQQRSAARRKRAAK